jgi:hypothetical protein
MAQDKKSILVYADWISIFDKLQEDEAGRLIQHFFRYVNDLNPIAPDRLTELLFEPIKITLKRDLKTWELERLKRSEAGKKGMKNRWDNKDNSVTENITKDNSVTDSITNITDSVTVSVTVNEKNKIYEEFNIFWDTFHLITGKEKTDKVPALKYWNKLKNGEHQKAIESIKPYFDSLSNKKYCKKARTYLSDKNFNDESINKRCVKTISSSGTSKGFIPNPNWTEP